MPVREHRAPPDGERWFSDLNPQQQAAVRHPGGPLLVLALQPGRHAGDLGQRPGLKHRCGLDDPGQQLAGRFRQISAGVSSDGLLQLGKKIALLVGHTGTATTETVYRKQIRPMVIGGAAVMDSLFPKRDSSA